MSRGGSDDYDEDFPNQAAFWWHNAERAMKGKRGRKALAELREALLMLPEKRLVEGAVSTAALKAKYEAEPDEEMKYDWHAKEERLQTNWRKRDALAKCDEEGIGVCVVGAYLMRKRVLELGETPEEAMRNLPAMADIEDHNLIDTAYVGEQAGLSSYVAYMLADRNDETYGRLTPEQRYDKFLAWLDEQLAVAA